MNSIDDTLYDNSVTECDSPLKRSITKSVVGFGTTLSSSPKKMIIKKRDKKSKKNEENENLLIP